MARAFLSEKSGERVEIGSACLLGRTKDCDYPIRDPAATRHHLEISFKRGEYHFRDLGTTNGTVVNGRKSSEGKLRHGDKIQIGKTTILFELEDKPAPPAAQSPLFRETILDDSGKASSSVRRTKADSLLMAVYSVINDIATNYDSCELVDHILQTTMKAIDAQRGAVFFADALDEELRGCPVCGSVHVIADGDIFQTTTQDIRISKSVAHRVLRNGESVLYQDADTDFSDDNQRSESIVALDLRSIICVPLRGKFGTLGILYIDSDRPKQNYTHDHMLLSTAVGNSAGLALENARLHREILDKQRIEQEIEHAATIQEGFLVKEWPEAHPHFEVYGETHPAKTVGGDFYDFVQPEENVVGLLIGDVSGKGVPAALAMARLLAEFRVRASQEPSPEKVMHALNENLCERSRRGMFVTLCYIKVNLVSGEVTVANAGHNPVLKESKGRVEEIAPASGPPLGILPDSEWSNSTFTLASGDRVVLYTDGITEARGADTRGGDRDILEPDEYGVESLMRVVENVGKRPLKELADRVMDSIHEHCEPDAPHDDCTLMMLRYLG